MCKKIILLITILNFFTIINLNSKNYDTLTNYLQLKKQIILPDYINSLSFDLNCRIYNNNLFVLLINPKYENILKLIQYSLSDTTTKLLNIDFNEKIFGCFDINDKYLVIGSDRKLFIYKNVGNKFEYYKSIKIPYPMYNCNLNFKLIDSIIYLYQAGISSQRIDNQVFASIISYDIENNNLNEIKFDNPRSIPLLYFKPRKILEMNKNFILYSGITEYTLRLYDLKKRLLDSIYLEFEFPDIIDKNEKDYLIKSTDENSSNPINNIEKLRRLTGDANLIHRVDFLNDSLFIVLRSKPLGGDYNYEPIYDLFQIKDNKIKIIKKGIKSIKRNFSNYYNNINIGNTYNISNNYIIIEAFVPFYINKPYKREELNEIIDKYLEENEPKISLFVYYFNF